jgi:hypothetical protein
LPWQQIKRERAKRLAELPNCAASKFHCAAENSCDYVCGSGRSVAWLARLPWAQEVASSNLAAPTILFDISFCHWVQFTVENERIDFLRVHLGEFVV